MSQSSSSPLFTPPDSPKDAEIDEEAATLEAPVVPGLHYFTDFFSSAEAEHIIEEIIQQGYFDVEKGRDQAVLFGSRGINQDAGLPKWTRDFLSLVASRFEEHEMLSDELFELLFPLYAEEKSNTQGNTYTRQLILNCYQPGQGISSHVDLPHKFLDGIMIFSFGSGIAMTFEDIQERTAKHSVYLLPSSLCVLSGESRWQWRHGIPEREGDYVWLANRKGKKYVKRGQRLSITVRWYRFEDDGQHSEEGMKHLNGYCYGDGQSGRDRKDTGTTDPRLAASSNG